MTPGQLEVVVARTGHERFRLLTSDANPDAGQREAYRRLVAQLADDEPPAPISPLAGEPATPVPLAASLHARKHGFTNCAFSYKDSACGCTGLQCHLLKRVVSLRDCVACLAKW